MSDDKKPSAPLRLFLRAVFNILLVALMAWYLPPYVFIQGGIGAYVVIGSLLTLMNILVRPVLALITFPLKLFATLIAVILANGVFIWITLFIAERLDPALVVFRIEGILGWIIVAMIVGTANWMMKHALK